MTQPIRVMIADDDPLVRAGLRLMRAGAVDLTIVDDVADGVEVVAAAERSSPSVILMDIRMPRLDGIGATRAVRALPDPPEVLVLTTFDTDETVFAALRAGAAGFLLKHTSPDRIIDAIRCAAAGEPVVSPGVLRTLIAHIAYGTRDLPATDRLNLLSDREREVAYAVAEGGSDAEIASTLFMSVGTVKAHISSALAKLDLNNRIRLALLTHDSRRGRSGPG